ncbi:MAG: RNA polymerase sigma factor [Saprospiraceae bacterium]|nr:RNA polymerase sigma factor [Saprospiraceae bacterium]
MTENKQLAFLIEGCRKGEERSQMELYRQYYSYGMGICLRYARKRELAVEMLNDGFLKVFTKIDQYNSKQAFRPWLRKILVNAAIDHYRKYSRDQADEPPIVRPAGTSYNEALDNLAFEDLLEIMRILPPAYRMVFNLYVVEGRTHAEIAKQLRISVGTSKSNLAKARLKIKEQLSASKGFSFKTKKYG